MAKYLIESGIEVAAVTRKGVSKYPWAEMGDGQSFLVPFAEGEKVPYIAASGSSWCKRHKVGFRVVQRLVPGGLRVHMQLIPPAPSVSKVADAGPKFEKKGK